MAKSFAEHMADTMPDDGGGADMADDVHSDVEDRDAAGHKAMEDLAKHLKDGDYEAAWSCFKDAAGIADAAEEEAETPAEEGAEDDMPVPGHGGGGHAALLLMPRGK